MSNKRQIANKITDKYKNNAETFLRLSLSGFYTKSERRGKRRR